ncbi:MAG: hypothetical protein WBQ17_11775 [Rhizomicrobium sp.]
MFYIRMVSHHLFEIGARQRLGDAVRRVESGNRRVPFAHAHRPEIRRAHAQHAKREL